MPALRPIIRSLRPPCSARSSPPAETPSPRHRHGHALKRVPCLRRCKTVGATCSIVLRFCTKMIWFGSRSTHTAGLLNAPSSSLSLCSVWFYLYWTNQLSRSPTLTKSIMARPHADEVLFAATMRLPMQYSNPDRRRRGRSRMTPSLGTWKMSPQGP